MATAVLALQAVSVRAQTLDAPKVDPPKATRNSVYYWSVHWDYSVNGIKFAPYAGANYILHGPEEVRVGLWTAVDANGGDGSVTVALDSDDQLWAVGGVWLTDDTTQKNYFYDDSGTPGTFDFATGEITLGTPLPATLPQPQVVVNVVTKKNNIVQIRMPAAMVGADNHHEVLTAAGVSFDPLRKAPEKPRAEKPFPCGDVLPLDQNPANRLIDQAGPEDPTAGWRTIKSPGFGCAGEQMENWNTPATAGPNSVTIVTPGEPPTPGPDQILPPGTFPVLEILGIFDNANGDGTNYFTTPPDGAPRPSFDKDTNELTFTLPDDFAGSGVWVWYTYDRPVIFNPTNPRVNINVAGRRVVEANVPVDPYGDGQTFYVRASPVIGVAGVFDSKGRDYFHDLLLGPGEFAGGPGEQSAQIVLPKPLPPTVTSVKIIYYVGPIALSGPGGQFTAPDPYTPMDPFIPPGTMASSSVPFSGGLQAPDRYGMGGSAGLNLVNERAGVPGIWYTSDPGGLPAVSPYTWAAGFIKHDPGIGRVSDTSSPRFGRLDTDVKTVDMSSATVAGSHFGYPTRIDRVGPTTREFVAVTPPLGSMMDVFGVWDNPDLTGTNYYTGGSFTTLGVITLGTQLPSAIQPVYVAYSYSGAGRWGGGGSADFLMAMRSPIGGSDPQDWDPLVAEQYRRDQNRTFESVADPRQFVPFKEGQPDDGNSSNTFSFRVQYTNSEDLPPLPWLPYADGYGTFFQSEPSGVILYYKQDTDLDYRPFSMFIANPATVNLKDAWRAFIAKVEPNAGMQGWKIPGRGRVGVPYWSNPNNYVSMIPGVYQYYFGASDDSLTKYSWGGLSPGGQLTNPMADWKNGVIDLGVSPHPKPATGGWDAPIREPRMDDPTDSVNWLERNPPVYRPGKPQSPTSTTLLDELSYVDKTGLQPGVGAQGYTFPATAHPVVHGLLAGLPPDPGSIPISQIQSVDVTEMVGSGRFLGTLSPFTRYVSPVFSYPSTGPADAKYENVGAPGSQLIETAGGTSSTAFTFRVIYQSIDPVTKAGRAPNYVRVFINNSSDASGAYTSYQMSATKKLPNGLWVSYNPTAADYKNGVIYSFGPKTLSAGPHTYYFEADAGFGAIRYPVRPDGRVLEKPNPKDGETPEPSPSWWVDAWVPGEAPNADNNDYCPGPYVNSAPVLSAPSVSPASGPVGTEFVFSVTYRDPDNQRPSKAQLIIETEPGKELRVDMSRVDPTPPPANYKPPYDTGVVYQYRLSSQQSQTFAIGDRRFRFEFTDDWGRLTDPNDVIVGELVNYPTSQTPGVTAWVTGPTISEAARPLLSSGSVSSSDGTSNPNTLWTYEVTYSQKNEVAPSYINVYIGSQRSPGDPLNVRTRERLSPSSTTTVKTSAVPVLSVSGVWNNADGTGTNYFTGGSVNANTGVITLGTALPNTGRDVWVTYASNPISWDSGHDMVKRNPSDNVYSDGAVYTYQTKLAGAQKAGDLPIIYYYSFQASDGTFVTRYNPVNSPSAQALTRQPAGEGSADTGEILGGGSTSDNKTYQLAHKPVVGPLPASAAGNPGVLIEPKVQRNGDLLVREFFSTLNSTIPSDNVAVNPSGLTVTVDPAVVNRVIAVRARTSQSDPTLKDYYNVGSQSNYNAATGAIALGTALPSGVRDVLVDYYNRGDYRIDFNNGKVTFTQVNQPSDVIEVEYWWGDLGPAAVGLNTPPSLTNGKFTPDNPGSQIDGTSQTPFTFSVVYTDTDGQSGDAPSFVRVVIDGQAFAMTPPAGSNLVYRNGVTFTYKTTLSGGSHLYYFEASDGTGFAAFDLNGSRSNLSTIGNIVPLPGPIVNNDPVLLNGAVSPNPVGGIDPGTPVTYSVDYMDADGDAPKIGYPRVYIDNPTSIDWSGKVTSVSGSTITVGGASFPDGQLANKFMQVTTGLVTDPDTGLVGSNPVAGGNVYVVMDNTVDTLWLAVDSASAQGIVVGDTVMVGALVMAKQNPAQTDYK
ncbi:MAG: hypothetical protein IT209_13205, partial [Armatimonadetes bacterium]|nr:hypothetical protein [Armatimonadota bacterium]